MNDKPFVWIDEATEEDVERVIGYCFKTVKERRDKEREMEFDKSRAFSSVNADELNPGDKVIVADTLGELQRCIGHDESTPIVNIKSIDEICRFNTIYGAYALAYLVERKENCTNCGNQYKYKVCDYPHHNGKCDRCDFYEPKTELPDLISLGNGQYAERKHYRPFKDVDELIKVWGEKIGSTSYWGKGADLTMPHIWVQDKKNEVGKAQHLITDFNVTRLNEDNDGYDVGITVNCEDITFNDLFDRYEFLDGSPCGVEE